MQVDQVLWTKLHRPRPPSTFIGRPRLAGRLDAALREPGVSLLCAPAGFGKSVTLAESCHRSGIPTAWVSLDANDNDALRFWRHVAAAIDDALGDRSHTLDAVDRSARRDLGNDDDGHALALISAIPPNAGPFTLALDDYHVIEREVVHAGMRYVLGHGPPSLHVAITSRADPPLDLAKRRAAGRLTEFRAADLRFSTEEGGSLLHRLTEVELSSQVVATLVEQTEGWAAGLQLAGLSLAGIDDTEGFAASFSGEHRFVLDYLAEEALGRQTPSLRTFLLETAVLDRLSGPLCDAVLDRTDSQRVLEEIERANLFTVPLDDVRGWWRYHHLFADLLRVRLHQQDRDRVVELNRRAADWFEVDGDIDRAIHHRIEEGDHRRAAGLIEDNADELLLRREGATLQRFFERLPAEHAQSRRMEIARARIAVYGGRVAEAELRLERADRLRSDEADPTPDTRSPLPGGPLTDLDTTTILLRAFVAHMRGDAEGAVELAAPVAARRDDVPHTLSLIAHWHLATAPWITGSVADAEPALVENVAAWRAIGAHDRAAWSARYLAQVQVAAGRLDDALETYRRVLDNDVDHDDPNSPAAGVAHVGIAEIAYERNDLATARLHVRLGISMCNDFVYTQALADGWLLLARIDHAEGNAAESSEAATAARQLVADNGMADLLNPIPARLAQLDLARGDTEAAARWAVARHRSLPDTPSHDDEPAELAAIRISLAEGRARHVVERLEQLRRCAVDDGRLRSVVEIDVLRALALTENGAQDRALHVLADALELAGELLVVRVVADAGPTVAGMVGTLLSDPTFRHRLDPDLVAALDEALTVAGEGQLGENERSVSQALVVPLSERELEVLSEVARGGSNQVIADQLFISLNTVKKHVTHILEKLGVTNRTAAVARARDLGLLPLASAQGRPDATATRS